jgi:hypothetical protein
MIPSWATAVLLGLGFGLFALVGALLRWQRPSQRRLERVVTFGLMGAVLVILGSAQIAYAAIAPTDRELAEAVVIVAVFACLPLCAAGLPAVRWWTARRAGRWQTRATDFAEDRDGNAVRVPPE